MLLFLYLAEIPLILALVIFNWYFRLLHFPELGIIIVTSMEREVVEQKGNQKETSLRRSTADSKSR